MIPLAASQAARARTAHIPGVDAYGMLSALRDRELQAGRHVKGKVVIDL